MNADSKIWKIADYLGVPIEEPLKEDVPVEYFAEEEKGGELDAQQFEKGSGE